MEQEYKKENDFGFLFIMQVVYHLYGGGSRWQFISEVAGYNPKYIMQALVLHSVN